MKVFRLSVAVVVVLVLVSAGVAMAGTRTNTNTTATLNLNTFMLPPPFGLMFGLHRLHDCNPLLLDPLIYQIFKTMNLN